MQIQSMTWEEIYELFGKQKIKEKNWEFKLNELMINSQGLKKSIS